MTRFSTSENLAQSHVTEPAIIMLAKSQPRLLLRNRLQHLPVASALLLGVMLLAGCGWQPGGPALETPTAIAPLILEDAPTRPPELETLAAAHAAGNITGATQPLPPAAPTVEDTPTTAPPPTETPVPVDQRATEAAATEVAATEAAATEAANATADMRATLEVSTPLAPVADPTVPEPILTPTPEQELAPVQPDSPLPSPTDTETLSHETPITDTLAVTTTGTTTATEATPASGSPDQASATPDIASTGEVPTEEAPTEEAPTETPTDAPTETPTETPTESPTQTPTETSTASPTRAPSETPTPTTSPTTTPTDEPTETPSEASVEGSAEGTVAAPTATPRVTPSRTPSRAFTSNPPAAATISADTISADTATDEDDTGDNIAAQGAVQPTVTLTATELGSIQHALRNTTVVLPFSGSVAEFPLSDGSGRPSNIEAGQSSTADVRLLAPIAVGDLDGDGVDEAVAYAEMQLGSRRLLYLLAFGKKEGEWFQRARVLLGQGSVVSPPLISEGRIELTVEKWQAGLPICCPISIERRVYQLEASNDFGDVLDLVRSELLTIEGTTARQISVQVLSPEDTEVAGEALPNMAHLYSVDVAGGHPFTITITALLTPEIAFQLPTAVPLQNNNSGHLSFSILSSGEPVMWVPIRANLGYFSATLPANETLLVGVRSSEVPVPYLLTIDNSALTSTTREESGDND